MTTLTPDQRPYTELVIVCGPPRSGTTWLARELCNSPIAFPFLPECSLITHQIEQYRFMKTYESKRFQAYFGTQENLLNFYRETVTRLINQVANLNQKTGAKTLVLKDPLLCLCLEDIKEVMPPHKLVVLIRDPRDVIASMKQVSARKKQKWNVRKEAHELLRYSNQIGSHHQRADKDNIFLRYEDIVVGQTSFLHDFLRQGSENMIFSQANVTTVSDKIDSSDPFFSKLYLQPTTSEKIGSYTKILSVIEIGYIEDVFSGVMQQWNYSGTRPIISKISSLLRRIRNLLR